mmetsp:Transcript_11825/g.19259  ORF Transcript_11825/g.19259 Transcript_11825/m.19259 type:complete len:244 (-) Transcript_11825:42-773(-)|eukprot:CAMPEP_0203775684 /NCGR_PEP_ID=MMETSP0099_2-20121227/6267_1 /ASSEMBLY_ACC=CAM_ASM_000209 /TAXON_ID=96639 /ORGANISM=" , Strain NY0313808BC1" /LENGTH=243 /DNA_ID=CAMNT_0050674487 /DNA_START=59 /DNA_END=790 /DNA_ORIENTATION=+
MKFYMGMSTLVLLQVASIKAEPIESFQVTDMLMTDDSEEQSLVQEIKPGHDVCATLYLEPVAHKKHITCYDAQGYMKDYTTCINRALWERQTCHNLFQRLPYAYRVKLGPKQCDPCGSPATPVPTVPPGKCDASMLVKCLVDFADCIASPTGGLRDVFLGGAKGGMCGLMQKCTDGYVGCARNLTARCTNSCDSLLEIAGSTRHAFAGCDMCKNQDKHPSSTGTEVQVSILAVLIISQLLVIN